MQLNWRRLALPLVVTLSLMAQPAHALEAPELSPTPDVEATRAASERPPDAATANKSRQAAGTGDCAPQVYCVQEGYDLDQYLYREDGPLNFAIDVPLSGAGPVDANGHPVRGNTLYGTTVRLTLRVFDVDEQSGEVDKISVNGTQLPRALSGADEQWSIVSFLFDASLLKLPTATEPKGHNEFKIDIDVTDDGWAVEVDWAEIRLKSLPLPVVLLHGLNSAADNDADGRADSMQDIADRFDREVPGLGPQQIAVPTLSNFDGIERRAQRLEKTVRKLREANGGAKVHLVGHSLGGLVARRYAVLHPEQVESVVMLATPNGGSPLAEAGCAAQLGGLFNPWAARVSVVVKVFGGECLPGNALWDLQTWWVRKYFNKTSDNPAIDYSATAGKGAPLGGFWLVGEDDGAVNTDSVFWLRRANDDVPGLGPNPGHPGLHQPLLPVYDLDHSEMHDASKSPTSRALCILYARGCSSVPGEAVQTDQDQYATDPLAAESEATFLVETVTVPASGTKRLKVDFEGAERGTLVAYADDLDALTATYNGTKLATETSLSGPMKGLLVEPAESGQLTLANSSGRSNSVLVIGTAVTPRRMEVRLDRQIVGPGEPVTVTATLTEPLGADEPHLVVTNEIDDVVFEGDLDSTGDGSWELETSVSQPGSYQVGIRSGEIETRVDGNGFFVTQGDVRVGRNVKAKLPDDDADGLADELSLSPKVTVEEPGSYRLSADLVSSGGAFIASATTARKLETGATKMRLHFDGAEIYRSNDSGPYRVANVVVTAEGSAPAVEVDIEELTQTATYDYATFEHDPVVIESDTFTDRGVDQDGNGLFNALVVNGETTVDVADTYALNARLTAADGSEIAQFQTEVTLSEGTNDIELTFDGAQIGQWGVDGPYLVEDLSLYPVSDASTLGYLVSVHTTSGYEATQFEQSGTDISGAILYDDTTWGLGGSPYRIHGTVQIAPDVALTIEPGVKVLADGVAEQMFLVHGALQAVGDSAHPVVLDGGGAASFVDTSDAPSTATVEIRYAEIKNGDRLYWGTGGAQPSRFELTDSTVTTVVNDNYVWYPSGDVTIARNTFSDSGGWTVTHDDAVVFFTDNVFTGASRSGAWIINQTAYSGPTEVHGNTFQPAGILAVELPIGYSNAAIDATDNYWSTTDTAVINAMILDKVDDLRRAGPVSYVPFRTEP